MIAISQTIPDSLSSAFNSFIAKLPLKDGNIIIYWHKLIQTHTPKH